MPCRKIPYASRGEAQIVANRTSGQKVYRCKVCGAWHTSRRSDHEVRRARKRGGYDS